MFRKFNIVLSKRSTVLESMNSEFYVHGKYWNYDRCINDNVCIERLQVLNVYEISIDSVMNNITNRHASAMRVAIDEETKAEMSRFDFRDDSYIEIEEEFNGFYVDMDVWDIDSMILADTGVAII